MFTMGVEQKFLLLNTAVLIQVLHIAIHLTTIAHQAVLKVHQVMTADLHPVQVGIKVMKNINHIAPLFNALCKNKIFWNGFVPGRNLRIFNYCAKAAPELSWDINNDFPFNPKQIPRLKDRKLRKSGYQSFALYKKSFKPRPKPKLKIYRDEWKTDDMADAMLYAYFHQQGMTRQDFEKQYMCTWDLASDHTTDKAVFTGFIL